MIRIRHIFVMTALALALTGAPAAAQHCVPIKANFTTTFVFIPPMLTLTSVGNASHLGNTAGYSVHTVDNMGNQSGTNVYIAANGDLLFSSYAGTGSPPDANGNITFSGTETFTGGTGRFSGATGTAQVQGTANLVTATGQWTATGTICT